MTKQQIALRTGYATTFRETYITRWSCILCHSIIESVFGCFIASDTCLVCLFIWLPGCSVGFLYYYCCVLGTRFGMMCNWQRTDLHWQWIAWWHMHKQCIPFELLIYEGWFSTHQSCVLGTHYIRSIGQEKICCPEVRKWHYAHLGHPCLPVTPASSSGCVLSTRCVGLAQHCNLGSMVVIYQGESDHGTT